LPDQSGVSRAIASLAPVFLRPRYWTGRPIENRPIHFLSNTYRPYSATLLVTFHPSLLRFTTRYPHALPDRTAVCDSRA